MKVLWRAVLSQWRVESRAIGTIPKETFPRLLARVYNHLHTEWLVSGFRACGIVPLDRTEVLKRTAGESTDGGVDLDVLNEVCLNLLKDYLGAGPASKKGKGKRGSKVTPGKPIRTEDENIWICADCNKVWCNNDDNRWIVCDRCDLAYHLQCSGVQYKTHDYDIVDIDGMKFNCDECS